jgi:hypothetical protein
MDRKVIRRGAEESQRGEKKSATPFFEYVKGRGRLVIAVGVAVGVH